MELPHEPASTHPTGTSVPTPQPSYDSMRLSFAGQERQNTKKLKREKDEKKKQNRKGKKRNEKGAVNGFDEG